MNIMHKIVGLALCAAILTGCSTTVEGWEIKQYIEGCTNKGGISSIDNFLVRTSTCMDGTIITASKINHD